jgi:hypothetical protein
MALEDRISPAMADKKMKRSDPTLATFDKRVIERLVTRGAVSRADLEAHLKALPDLEDQADNIADRVYPTQPGSNVPN